MNDKVKAVAGAIVLATDASVGPDHVASGYLATTGHTGLRAHLYPRYLVRPHSRVVVTELRAVYRGLKAVLGTIPGRPIEVRVDNLQALRYLHGWQQGGTDMPEGYDTHLRSQGRKPSLVKLQMLAEYTPHVTFVHEKAHAGHPLNEAADSLAKLGLRCLRGTVPRTELPRLVPLWATGALTDYRRSQAA
ncbi:RNase H family protein [Streptomyces sp. TP-A0356]|uniref:RNase H family protein n=1 Tax=Streptomyces sp. TP-A0356 TaxID=1359208 RepID=UPI0006E3D732|nr:RNase H family protein [Streptomyces sp. TP-A0356]